jgi:hypothetical protein
MINLICISRQCMLGLPLENEYEEQRRQTILHNSRVAASLGLTLHPSTRSSAKTPPTSITKDTEHSSDSEFDPADCDGELTQEDALVDYPLQHNKVSFLCPVIELFVPTSICCIPVLPNMLPMPCSISLLHFSCLVNASYMFLHMLPYCFSIPSAYHHHIILYIEISFMCDRHLQIRARTFQERTGGRTLNRNLRLIPEDG